MLDFLRCRLGCDGAPVLEDLARPEYQGEGWWRCRWLPLTEQELHTLVSKGWCRAWHGTKIEAMYSILYHGRVFESRDWDSRGERTLTGAPGVYIHPDETAKKTETYMRWVPLCDDSIFRAVKFELRTDPNHRVKTLRPTDQEVYRAPGVRIVALWLGGRTRRQMVHNDHFVSSWDPELEANPRDARWAAKTEEEDMLYLIDAPDCEH